MVIRCPQYCECFIAGVLCTSRCKCKNCKNVAGSQKLIDKRRQLKDTAGAVFAMEVSDRKWRSQALPSKIGPELPPGRSLNDPSIAKRKILDASFARAGTPTSPSFVPVQHFGPRPPQYLSHAPPPPYGARFGYTPHVSETPMSPEYFAPPPRPSFTPPALKSEDKNPGRQRGLVVQASSPPPPSPSSTVGRKQPYHNNAAESIDSRKITSPKISVTVLPQHGTPRNRSRSGKRAPSDDFVEETAGQPVDIEFSFGRGVSNISATLGISVFGYLSADDRSSASRVCRQWSKVLSTHSFDADN